MRYRALPPAAVELYHSPELAVLAVLDVAIAVALVALVAAHPQDEPDADDVPVDRRAARGVITAAHELSTALDRYFLALARARERARGEDEPF